MVFHTKMLQKLKQNGVYIYVKLDIIVRPFILYLCKRFGNLPKKDISANKILKEYVSRF